MPPIPIAGKAVGDELNQVCNVGGTNKCPNLTKWFNKIILFRTEYEIMDK